MSKYIVTDEEGRTIVEGDTITDFRGDTSTFRRVTRGVEYNGTAKVQVEDGREFYAQVFNLTVISA